MKEEKEDEFLTEEDINKILANSNTPAEFNPTIFENIEKIVEYYLDKELEKIAEEVPELKKYLKSKEI